MREIKFRCWNKRKNCWYEENDELCLTKDGDLFDTARYSEEWIDLEKDNYILMQYTGLKDKNGKEIYEGDIIKGMHSSKYRHCNEIIYEKDGVWNYSYDIIEWGDNPEMQWEVIGNKYENPELLGVKE